MANPDEKVIAPIDLSGSSIADDGSGRIGFVVTWKESRSTSVRPSLAGIVVTANIVAMPGTTFPENGGPLLSGDEGKTWDSYADKNTDKAGTAIFHVKSGAGAGAFKVSGAIGDADLPYHKTTGAPLTAKGSIAAIDFSPSVARTTWQGEPFPSQPAIIVSTKPNSGQMIDLSLAGPGATTDPADYNAAFVAGGQKSSAVSGSPLPPVKAGKMMGPVTITAAVGTVHSDPMTWQVKPIPDRLASPHPGVQEHIGFGERKEHLRDFKFKVTGNRVLGSTDPMQVVDIPDWPVRLELTETTHAEFVGQGMQDRGKFLITQAGAAGSVFVPSSQLDVKDSAEGQEIKIVASWNEKHDASGGWRASPGDVSQLRIFFNT